jgi:hypothetical protein
MNNYLKNRFMVFNSTFNNISVISWWSVLLVEKTGVNGENHPWYALFNFCDIILVRNVIPCLASYTGIFRFETRVNLYLFI